jgi:predicted nucleic acid-binding protein
MIVADTNLIAYLLIDGEATATARRAFERDPDWRVPPLWRSEFLNVLATAVRAGILAETQAFDAWDAAVDAFGDREEEPGAEPVLATAIRLRISAYNAHFVALAERSGSRLVTSDRGILRACPDVAVSIRTFASGA